MPALGESGVALVAFYYAPREIRNGRAEWPPQFSSWASVPDAPQSHERPARNLLEHDIDAMDLLTMISFMHRQLDHAVRRPRQI